VCLRTYCRGLTRREVFSLNKASAQLGNGKPSRRAARIAINSGQTHSHTTALATSAANFCIAAPRPCSGVRCHPNNIERLTLAVYSREGPAHTRPRMYRRPRLSHRRPVSYAGQHGGAAASVSSGSRRIASVLWRHSRSLRACCDRLPRVLRPSETYPVSLHPGDETLDEISRLRVLVAHPGRK
jgi:hypothetical protein